MTGLRSARPRLAWLALARAAALALAALLAGAGARPAGAEGGPGARPAAAPPAASPGHPPGPSLLQAEEPNVRAGNERLAAGDAAGALSRYDAAEKALGPRAEIDFDRGNALFAQGKQAEAQQAWRRAQEADARGRGTLSSRALQNMGNSLEAAGDRDGAVKAFAESLRRDPANEDARYNLEVLLRRRAEGKGAPEDQGEQGQRKQDGPPQQGAGAAPPQDGKPGQDGQPPPAPQPQPQPPQKQQQPPQPGDGKDEGRREREAGEQRDGKRDHAGQGGQAEARPHGEGGQGEVPAPGDLDRREAERILDTLRSRERPMPLGPAARAGDRRRDVQKDW